MILVFRLTGASVFCLLLFGQMATALDKPLVTPSRDVDVTYVVMWTDQAMFSKRVRWRVSEDLERVDGPDGSATIFDHRRNDITLLNPASRTFLKLEGTARQPLQPETDDPLKRGDEAIIAGLRCVDWTWTEEAETHTVCLTGDGVLLRLVVDGNTTLLARSVAYGPQRADLFQSPLSYTPALVPGGLVL